MIERKWEDVAVRLQCSNSSAPKPQLICNTMSHAVESVFVHCSLIHMVSRYDNTNTNSVRVAPLKRAHLPFCRWRAVVGANDDRVGSEVLRTHNDKYNVSTFRACISPTNRIRQMAKFPKQSHGHCHSISEMWIASPAAVCIFFSLVLHQNGTKPKLLKSRETFCRHSITASLELFDRWLSCFCLRLRGAIEKKQNTESVCYIRLNAITCCAQTHFKSTCKWQLRNGESRWICLLLIVFCMFRFGVVVNAVFEQKKQWRMTLHEK